MRLQALSTLILLAAAALLAGQSFTPLNVQTGVWQVNQQVTLTGDLPVPPELAANMTPAMRAQIAAEFLGPNNITYKTCVTPAKLAQDPFPPKSSPHASCTETVVSSTSTDLTVQIACAGDVTGGGQVNLHASDTHHVTANGNGTVTAEGKTLHDQVSVTAQWIGPTCPPDVH
ncbi:MAG: DUF3617 domain-containing protein [Terriglobales bacterium]